MAEEVPLYRGPERTSAIWICVRTSGPVAITRRTAAGSSAGPRKPPDMRSLPRLTAVKDLQKFEAARPDLVVLDLTMPVLDGWGVLERLRQMADPPPRVILSATGDGRRAMREGQRTAFPSRSASATSSRPALFQVSRVFTGGTVTAALPLHWRHTCACAGAAG